MTAYLGLVPAGVDPAERYPTVGEFGRALTAAAEAARGVSLETKAAVAALAPSLLATRAFMLLVRVAAGGLCGLLPYAYLAIIAGRSDVSVWGGLQDGASVLRYLTLGDYAHNRGLPPLGVLSHALAWWVWALAHLLD